MADPSTQREVMQQTNQPTSLSFNSTPPASLVAPNPQHPPFHYPQVYVDPVTAAAFYQQHRHPHSTQQPNTSQPVASQPHPQHAPRTSQSQQTPVSTQQHPPYYIPDMAAVAIQQMQLQTMLQLQAQHAQNHPQANSSLPQRQQSTHLSQQSQQIIPHHTTATSQSSVQGLLPIPPHITRALAASQSVIPHPGLGIVPHSVPHSSPLPIVPEAQMASAYRIGRYTPAERKIRLERYREKRAQRNYNRRVKYDCRKQIADKRRRVQGRFVKREEEAALAASEHTNGTASGTTGQHRSSEATDATEEETKLQHPESSGSASSVRQLDVGIENGGPDDATGGGEQGSFCEQSDHMLQTFR